MRIIVKGTREEAEAAAAARSIPFTYIMRLDKWGEVIGTVPDDVELDVQRWFCEPPLRAPFEVGTCLHYSKT